MANSALHADLFLKDIFNKRIKTALFSASPDPDQTPDVTPGNEDGKCDCADCAHQAAGRVVLKEKKHVPVKVVLSNLRMLTA